MIKRKIGSGIYKRPIGWTNRTSFKKGQITWNKGKKHSQETKERMSIAQKGKYSGDKNPAWKGGIVKSSNGYVWVHSPNHPHKDTHNHVYEHRLVMEKHLKRYLLPTEDIHHINGIKNDNRIENLKLFKNRSEHIKSHYKNGSKFGINCPSRPLLSSRK